VRKRNVVILILVLIGVALLIYYYVFIRLFAVPSAAMANTVIPGDRVIGVRSFGGAIERGQIVVFRFPDESTYYLKRVVGLPGETIQLRDQTVYVNGQPLAEQKVLVASRESNQPLMIVRPAEGRGPYSVFYEESAELAPPDVAQVGTLEPYRIPPEHYFVLGDNRDNSLDSRYRGPVPRQLIWGTVSLVFFSTEIETGDVRPGRILKRLE
jgi:signal peptidase I